MKLNLEDYKTIQPPDHFKVNECCHVCKNLGPLELSTRSGVNFDFLLCYKHGHVMRKGLTLVSKCKDYEVAY